MHLRFYCSDGKLHDKLLHNVFYAPNVPVRLISIPQLGRDTAEQSYFHAGGSESTLVWSDSSITLKHSPHSGVPFLQAHVGNEQLQAFYNMCYLAQNGINPTTVNLTGDRDTPANTYSTNVVHEDNPIATPAHDVNQHLDATVTHMHNILCHPHQNATQHDYNLWHYKLGHLSYSQLQFLVTQGKLPKQFLNCDPTHHLQCLKKGFPGSLIFADQMTSSTPGLIPQSTGSLTKRQYRAATIFVDSFSNYTHLSLIEDLSMASTLSSKLDFEQKPLNFGVTVKGYHADNGGFADAAWRDSCHTLHQTTQFCGVGSHHQNGIAEQHI